MYPNIKALRRDMARRLRRGESMVLHGPYGSGKSTLLRDLEARMHTAGIRCIYAPQTQSTDDIAHALDAAAGLLQRSVPGKGNVLLFDHLTDLTHTMLRYLHKVHGDLTGVLVVVDDEIERHRPQLRPWRMASLAIRMPQTAPEVLHKLLEDRSVALRLPTLDAEVTQRLIRSARGRPGWILECAKRQTDARYWQGKQLFVSAVCGDTETALGAKALEMLARGPSPASAGIRFAD